MTESEIKETWNKNITEPLVSIICTAYNHEKYIRQALNGFLSQKTTFPFEVIVHDDASVDNTAQIIREYESKYPSIIKPIYQIENQYSKGVPIGMTFMYPNARGKYISECEADDYWCDENKLQMQVSFLEEHPDFGMTYAKVYSYIQKDNKYGVILGEKAKTIKDLIQKGNIIPTQTICYRKELLFTYFEEIHPETKMWKMGDYPFNLWMIQNQKIHFFNKIFGVYRVLEKSASHSDNLDFLLNFAKSTNEIIHFFKEKYNISCRTPNHETIILFKKALAENDRTGILKYAKYSELLSCSFLMKLKVFVFKSDFLYKIFCKYKKIGL